MELRRAILTRRSIRRFKQRPVSKNVLKRLVDLARLAPSAANKQPLIYLIVDRRSLCEEVFKTLKWASFINRDINEGARPTAYIVVIVNRDISQKHYEHDSGMAIENILLSATADGLGSCCIGSINKNKLRKILNIPKKFYIDKVVALGYPAEKPLVEEMRNPSEYKYWDDPSGQLHVPKRMLKDIISRNKL